MVLLLLHQLIGGYDVVVVVPLVTKDVEEAGVDFDLDVTIVIEEVDMKLFVVIIDSGNGRGRELVGVRVGVEWKGVKCGVMRRRHRHHLTKFGTPTPPTISNSSSVIQPRPLSSSIFYHCHCHHHLRLLLLSAQK